MSGLALVVGMVMALGACSGIKPGNAKAMQPLKEATVSKLKSMGSAPGKGMLIRIFKQSSELEVWKETAQGYKLFKTYEICAWSGDLGPKIKEGDRQSPEGFYTITPGLMNPNSNYYLAFNTGFPNKFDRAYGRKLLEETCGAGNAWSCHGLAWDLREQDAGAAARYFEKACGGASASTREALCNRAAPAESR